MSTPRHRSIYQINTRVWLQELSGDLGRPVSVADIPDTKLDQFATSGFDLIWFSGIWKISPAGQKVSASNPDWRPGYEETLGASLREDDICGSPFAVQEYVVHPDFGGNEALHSLRDRLRGRGLRLILDFVANHTALDHPWVKERPEFYIHGTEADLAAEPYNYCRVETRCGTRILAYGRDPYYHGWPDTLQLNFRHPALYDAMSQQLLQIAKMCDGVRCDLAMLMLPDIFYGKTWGTRSEPADGALASDRAFWPDAIALVRRHYRDFVFIAEVYWDKEWEMQQQGFDYTYDKRLYDRLVQQNAEAVRSHLRGGNVDFQRKLVRFLENHDERRAASVFPPEVHRAAAVVAFLTPGLRLLHEGQLEGRKVKVSIHLKRRPVEVADLSVREFYSRLLPCIARPEVQNGRWQLLECLPEWDANPSWKQFIAFCWVGENGNRLLAAVNYAPHRGQCFVKLPFPDLRGRSFCLQDLLGTEKYQREGNALVERGLYLNMRAWSYSVFEFVEQPAEIPGLKLCRTQRGHKGMINRIAWSPDGHQLASGSNDRTIRIWNIETGKESHVNENRQVLAIAWSWDGKRLASGGGDSCIGIWKTEPFGKIRSLAGHSDWVNSVAWLPATLEVPTPKALVSTSADFTVRLWDTESGEHRILGKHQNNVFCVACSPDGHTIASASADNTVRLWDITTGQPGPVLEGHTDQVLCVTWAPDGHTIASASTDNTVRVWEAETGRLITILEAHTDDVRAVSLSFDGRLLASKGADAAVRIWRYDNWQIVAELHEQNGDAWLSGLAFHPQRPVLATLGEFDTVIRIWDLEVESLLAASSLTPRLQYTSAKIVLVGEAGVGKSSLATRLVEDRFPNPDEALSTLGMRFLSMPAERIDPSAVPPEGERREVVLWDMGGHDEYRLVHQLFLHDTTLALVFLDPTRGRIAFEDVEAWNRRLEKQFGGRPAVKLLVGSKVDHKQAEDVVFRTQLNQLEKRCGFADYIETSAYKGQGIDELKQAISKHLDWGLLAKTSRRELFQRVRDEIKRRRDAGEIVLRISDLEQTIREADPDNYDPKAVGSVAEQLAQHGVIADTQLASGDRMLVLQIEQIARYAGSLIVAARNNPRGIPALEERTLGMPDLRLPGIETRLLRYQELIVLECVVELLIQHGICFRHEGLLIFPTLFAYGDGNSEEGLPYARSRCYEITGAIENIYASVVALLVVGKKFGQHRLWPNRTEFEEPGKGICGIQQIKLKGGLGRICLYFAEETEEQRRELFRRFVEEHFRHCRVKASEHQTIECKTCHYEIAADIVAQNSRQGKKEVMCPMCWNRTSIGEEVSQKPDSEVDNLRQKSEKRMKDAAEEAKKVVRLSEEEKAPLKVDDSIRILHLSDLHFTLKTLPEAKVRWLVDDIKKGECLGFKNVEHLVISGDMTDRGVEEGFEKAREFVSLLNTELGLSADRCIFVPGNHDVQDQDSSYVLRQKANGVEPERVVKGGNGIILVRNEEAYPNRFSMFSNAFFHKIVQKPYPLGYKQQGIAYLFPELRIQFLTLNSCWQIDQFNRKRACICPEAVAWVIKEADEQIEASVKRGDLPEGTKVLRFGVWHHAVAGREMMDNTDFIDHLQKSSTRVCLHGDVHEMRRELIHYWHKKKMYIVGAGSFASAASGRPESTPRLYNLLEVRRDLTSIRVHTRCQPKPDGVWKAWNEWPRSDGGEGALPYFDIDLA